MRVYLETFGCQMNELDSELVRGQLLSLGHEFVPHPDEAQVVLFNTCSVREHAEQKVYSRLGLAGVRKKQGEQLIVGVIGCMAERDGVDLFKRYPQVDLMCGPGELDRLPLLIDNAARADAADRSERVALAGNKSRRSATLQAAEDNLELLDLSRAFEPVANDAKSRSAYVRITRGCNKFCTYCVVPHTRGAEVHRPPSHIVDECKRLVDAGVLEITLLGQTINHYRYTHGTALTVDGHEAPQVGPGLAAFRKPPDPGARTTTFADLLHRIHEEVPALLDDVIRRAMNLGAAGVGNHAVGAELVAATGDAHIRRTPFRPGRRRVERPRQVEELEVVVGRRERGRTARLAAREGDPFLAARSLGAADIVDEGGEAVEFAGAAQEVDLRESAEHVGAVALGHAAEHAEDDALARLLAQAHEAETRICLVFRLFPHRAGVVEHDVGARGVVDEAVAEAAKVASDELAVELVHLAPKGLEVDGRPDGHGRRG